MQVTINGLPVVEDMRTNDGGYVVICRNTAAHYGQYVVWSVGYAADGAVVAQNGRYDIRTLDDARRIAGDRVAGRTWIARPKQ